VRVRRRAKAFVVTAKVTSPSKKAGISVHRATRRRYVAEARRGYGAGVVRLEGGPRLHGVSTPGARRLGRPLRVSVGRLLVLLVSLAGLFAMHGMSDHGTAGPSEVASTQVVHLTMPMPEIAPGGAKALAGPAAHTESPPQQPIGGHDMGLAGLCLAVLVAVLLLSSGLLRRLRHAVRTGTPAWPARIVGVARARAPTPPDLFALSVQRC
jgi:hypothetical protein